MYIILLFLLTVKIYIYVLYVQNFFRGTIHIKFVSDYLYKTFCLTLTMNI